MKCIACGAETSLGTTVDVTDLSNCLVIVRNVPCRKCKECSEIIYTGDVIRRLESIVKNAKMAINEIAVIDYKSIAA